MEISELTAKGSASEVAEEALRAFERANGVHLTVHDIRGRLRDAKGAPLLPTRHLHRHTLCLRWRHTLKSPKWNANCMRDCYVESERIAGRDLKPFTKRCWKGLVELVVPIETDGAHVLTIFAGPFGSGVPPSEELLRIPWFSKGLTSLKKTSRDELKRLAAQMRPLGLGLLALARSALKAADGETHGRSARVADIIAANVHRRDFKLADAAKLLHLSPSRASHAVKEACGRPFKALLLGERLLRARSLLLASEMKLEAVAQATGFANCHYFHRAFKKAYGESPGAFRRRNVERGRSRSSWKIANRRVSL
jgi:AraC-like DNA-binding protein